MAQLSMVSEGSDGFFFRPSQESFTCIEAVVSSWMLEENEMLEENPCLWPATLQTF